VIIMRLYVPRVGSHIRLLQDWTFNLYHDYRNQEALSAVGKWDDKWYMHREKISPGSMTLPSGTELVVDRVYIRRPTKSGEDNDFDSLTFLIAKGGLGNFGAGERFFARVDDCNTAEIEIVGENSPSGLGAAARYKRDAAGLPPRVTQPKQTLGKRELNVRLRMTQNSLYASNTLEQAIRRSISSGDEQARRVRDTILRESFVQSILDKAYQKGHVGSMFLMRKIVTDAKREWDAKPAEKWEEPFFHNWYAHTASVIPSFFGKYTFNEERTQATQAVHVAVTTYSYNVCEENPAGETSQTWTATGTVTFDFPSGEVIDVTLN
jgi:hypothetical protein